MSSNAPEHVGPRRDAASVQVEPHRKDDAGPANSRRYVVSGLRRSMSGHGASAYAHKNAPPAVA